MATAADFMARRRCPTPRNSCTETPSSMCVVGGGVRGKAWVGFVVVLLLRCGLFFMEKREALVQWLFPLHPFFCFAE